MSQSSYMMRDSASISPSQSRWIRIILFPISRMKHLNFHLAFWLFLTGTVGAQENGETPAVPETDTAKSLLDSLIEGGPWLMIPLAALSFIAVLLIIFYLFTIRQGAVVSDKFMNAADALIRKQDYLGLIAVCNRENECIARIVYKTLDFATKNPTASFDEVREVTEAE